MLKGKNIVLGITGSIAAYKSCLIIRELIKDGAEVQVIITPAGKEFITPVTLSALTHKPVVSEFFSQKDGTWNSHVDLGLCLLRPVQPLLWGRWPAEWQTICSLQPTSL